jgi:serine/threonine-protein kinase
VLVYSLVEPDGGFIARDTLLSVFWPESDTERARNALRQSLGFIRATLGADVLEGRGRQSIGVRSSRLTCDALRFEELLDAGAPADALSLYRGDFLAGFHVAGSREFTDWVDRRRGILREGAAHAAWSLAYSCEDEGHAADAAFWGKRALSLSPFAEPEVQRLMELLDRVGDRAGALRAYRGLEAHLWSEYESEPSPETRELLERVRRRTRAGEPPDSIHVQDRRSPAERRRQGERRRSMADPDHPERRAGDRRDGERRSGADRRAPPHFPWRPGEPPA